MTGFVERAGILRYAGHARHDRILAARGSRVSGLGAWEILFSVRREGLFRLGRAPSLKMTTGKVVLAVRSRGAMHKGRTGMSAPHKQKGPLEGQRAPSKQGSIKTGLHQNGAPSIQIPTIRGGRSGPSGGGPSSRRIPTSTRCRNQSHRYRLRDGRCRFAWCRQRAGGLLHR